MKRVQMIDPTTGTRKGLSPESYATTLSVYLLFLQPQADFADGRMTLEEYGKETTRTLEDATS